MKYAQPWSKCTIMQMSWWLIIIMINLISKCSFWTSAGFGAGSPPSPAEEPPGQSHVHSRVCSWREWHLFHFWAWPYHAKRGGLPGAQVGEPSCQLDDLKHNELVRMWATHNDPYTLMCDNIWVCLFTGKGSVFCKLLKVHVTHSISHLTWRNSCQKLPARKKEIHLTCDKYK